MKVRDLIEHLRTLPDDGIVLGQIELLDGTWFTAPVLVKNIAKVPGDNDLVVLQLKTSDVQP